MVILEPLATLTLTDFNSEAQFQCKLNKPNVSVKWEKDKKQLFPGPKYTIEAKENVYSLTLHKVAPNDEGKYTFTVQKETCSADLLIQGDLPLSQLFILQVYISVHIHSSTATSSYQARIYQRNHLGTGTNTPTDHSHFRVS